MKKTSLSYFLLFLLSWLLVPPGRMSAQVENPLPVMPLPAHMVRGQGQFPIDQNLEIVLQGHTDPRLELAKKRFLTRLARQTGIPFWHKAALDQPNFVIKTAGPALPVQKLGEDESYHLEVSPTHVELAAPNPLGILRGLQTFLQLVTITPTGFSVPAVTIDDHPRFPWRGLMIDSSRHFISVPVIERDLDGMEAVKLNVFHWHLSDDQGFRAESKRFPLLQKEGSDGLYYTQEEMREVIEYARDRGIRVVPEFDMPCHTASWFAGYPFLAAGKGPHNIAIHMGVMDEAMDPTKESTYRFIDSFIGEMAALFPDEYFHIGGDECNGKWWNSNPEIQRFMRAHGIADNAALQAYFTARVQKLVAGHHKIMEGWDEVLQPGTPKNVLIQSWRGQTALAQAARQGNRGILSTPYYLNLDSPTSQYYLADPLGGGAAALGPEQRARILGGEAAMWTEFATSDNINSQIWPYLAAIAERLWSAQDVRDVDSMYARLPMVSQKLESCEINPRAVTNEMLQRMSGNPDPVPLKVLAAIVKPPSGYRRYDLEGPEHSYTTFTPLNRMVDAVLPESETGLAFNALAKRIVAGEATQQQWQEAREWLVLWRDNDTKLQPLLSESYITQEVIPLSQGLSQVAAIGLQALDNLENHRTVSTEARQNDLQQLKSAEQPVAVLVDTAAPSVELLVEATKTQ